VREVREGDYEGQIGVRDDNGLVADGREMGDTGVDGSGESESWRPEDEGPLGDRPVRDVAVIAGDELVEFAGGREHDRRELSREIRARGRGERALEAVLGFGERLHWYKEGAHVASLGMAHAQRIIPVPRVQN
jgi:hypothetical protein